MKDVRIKFVNISSALEQVIRKSINSKILSGEMMPDSALSPKSPKLQREDIRAVFIYPPMIEMHFFASKKLGERFKIVKFIYLSVGGCCIQVPQDFILSSGSEVSFNAQVIDAELGVIRGKLLGKSYSDSEV